MDVCAVCVYVCICFLYSLYTHISMYILEDFRIRMIGLCTLTGGRMRSACQQLYPALVLRVQFSQQIIRALSSALIPHLAVCVCVCVSNICVADCVCVCVLSLALGEGLYRCSVMVYFCSHSLVVFEWVCVSLCLCVCVYAWMSA